MRHIVNLNRFYAEICKTSFCKFLQCAVTVFAGISSKKQTKNPVNNQSHTTFRMHLYGLHSITIFFKVQLQFMKIAFTFRFLC